jgi:hypothetical protein
MDSVIKDDGHPCQCGFCRPDLNLITIDQEIPVAQPTSRFALELSGFKRNTVPVRDQVPASVN